MAKIIELAIGISFPNICSICSNPTTETKTVRSIIGGGPLNDIMQMCIPMCDKCHKLRARYSILNTVCWITSFVLAFVIMNFFHKLPDRQVIVINLINSFFSAFGITNVFHGLPNKLFFVVTELLIILIVYNFFLYIGKIINKGFWRDAFVAHDALRIEWSRDTCEWLLITQNFKWANDILARGGEKAGVIFKTEDYGQELLNVKINPFRENTFQSKRAYLKKYVTQAEQELMGYAPQLIHVHILSGDYDGESSLCIYFDGVHLIGKEPFTDRQVDIYSVLELYVY